MIIIYQGDLHSISITIPSKVFSNIKGEKGDRGEKVSQVEGEMNA